MKKLVVAATAVLAFAAAGCDQISEMTGGLSKAEKNLVGEWECKIGGGSADTAQITKTMAEFTKDNEMTMTFTFEGDMPAGKVKLDVAIDGEWAYDKKDDEFSNEITGARVGNMSLAGKSMSRSEYPGGEATLEQMEKNFMDQYGDESFEFKDVSEDELELVDSAGTKLSCEPA